MHANMHARVHMIVTNNRACMCPSICRLLYLREVKDFLMRAFPLFYTLPCKNADEFFCRSLPKSGVSYKQHIIHCF